jgi:hypothetical protein
MQNRNVGNPPTVIAFLQHDCIVPLHDAILTGMLRKSTSIFRTAS